MKKYLALLRGINVSGHNMIKMDALKTVLENAGFTDVQTYIQTGNVFVSTTETEPAAVGFRIKQEIFKAFAYDVPVVMVSKEELFAAINNNPFLKENADLGKLYFAFLSMAQKDDAIHLLKMSQFKPDEAIISGNCLFIKYAVGAGKTRLDQKYIEKKLGVTATIRNWNTTNKLLEMFDI